jgi:hypothetical protein
LVGALEFRCSHEIIEAIGKLTFDRSIEKISCVTLHKDFSALTNETVLPQVGPYPGPEVFLGLAYAKCEKTREEKGKTSGEFVSDSWFG